MSPDDVAPLQLPLAKAAEKVCASMHVVLEKTKGDMDREFARLSESGTDGAGRTDEKSLHLRRTKAAEVRIVKYQKDLRDVEVVFGAKEVAGIV